jgi:hypothetical protein
MQRQSQSWLCRGIAIGALALLSSGCSTPTAMTDVWREPSYTAGPMRTIVVFGGRMDAANRRTLEKGFVSALAQHGIRATAWYSLFPELPSKDVARTALQGSLRTATS